MQNLSRGALLASLSATVGLVGLSGCSGGAGISSSFVRRREGSATRLALSTRRERVQFPIWQTPTTLRRHGSSDRRTSAIRVLPGDGGGSGDPTGPDGSTESTILSIPNWDNYIFRNTNATSLYDVDGILQVQTRLSAATGNALNLQIATADGNSSTYVLPAADTVPVDTWVAAEGSQFYMNTSTLIGTVLGANGVTYTFSKNSNGDMIIHSNDGVPDITIPSAYLVASLAAPGFAHVHSSGLACNTAGFIFGMTGLTTIIGTVVATAAASRAGRNGAAVVLGGGLSFLKLQWDAMMAICNQK